MAEKEEGCGCGGDANRIESLERIIPKLKKSGKIRPDKIEAMEWELKYLLAKKEIKCLKGLVLLAEVFKSGMNQEQADMYYDIVQGD